MTSDAAGAIVDSTESATARPIAEVQAVRSSAWSRTRHALARMEKSERRVLTGTVTVAVLALAAMLIGMHRAIQDYVICVL